MSLVSVVVPVYDVRDYLLDCLRSLAVQTHRDLDVVVVDDGSTDGSGDIAAEFARQDARFRVLRQRNAGLGAARNAGAAAAHGEFLGFVDSDDAVPPTAYERLLASVRRTGSDFATARFVRWTPHGTRSADYARAAFTADRDAVHITGFHDLLVDRMATNKLFRRAFWERHALRFGEGVSYEDYYATHRAFFLADAVDVLRDNVYFWRVRADRSSISQRRLEPAQAVDRLAAVAATSRFLAEQFPGEKAWVERTFVRQDLVYLPEVVAGASGAQQVAVVDAACRWLAQTDGDVTADLPAARRVMWALLADGDADAIAAVLAAEPGRDRPGRAVRRRDGWYADLPRSRRWAVPPAAYAADAEIELAADVARIDRVGRSSVAVAGAAWFAPYAPRPGGRPRRFSARLRAGDRTLPAAVEVSAADGGRVDFRLLVDADAVAAATPGAGTWRLELAGRAVLGPGRATDRVTARDGHAVAATSVRVADRRWVRVVQAEGAVLVHVERRPVRLVRVTREGDRLLLFGTGRVGAGDVVVATAATGSVLELAAEPDGTGWCASVPAEALRDEIAVPTAPRDVRRADAVHWTLALRQGERTRRVWPGSDEQEVCSDGRYAVRAVAARGSGVATLAHERVRPAVSSVTLTASGARVHVAVPPGLAVAGYVVVGADGHEQDVGATDAADGPVLDVVVDPGRWHVCWRDRDGVLPFTSLGVAASLRDALPLEGAGSRPGRVTFGVDRYGGPLLAVGERPGGGSPAPR